MQKIMFELCKDRLVSEDNEEYDAFGVRVLENSSEIASFPDVSLKRERVMGFVNLLSGEEYSDAIMSRLVEAVAVYGAED